MPFVPGGELYKIYQSKKRFNEKTVKFYAAQMAKASAGAWDSIHIAFPCSTGSVSRFFDANTGELRANPYVGDDAGPPIVRDHDKKDRFVGPRFMMRVASLDMHPLDTVDRVPATKEQYGSGMCNITRCCTEVCPEHINITDNAIIPMKERVVDRYYDPIAMVMRKIFGGK